VGKDNAKISEVHPVRFVKAEILITEAYEQFVPAQGLGSISKDRTEAIRRRDHTTCKDKARDRSRNWKLAELYRYLCVDRRETPYAGGLKVDLMALGIVQGASIRCADKTTSSVHLREQTQ
jgi:hypothetical protein